MNLKAHHPGFKVWTGAQGDIDRIKTIWRDCLTASGGPFLFGGLTIGLGGTWVEGLIVNGLIAGVGMLLTFVPLMALMFVALAVLEDSGYLARAAVVTDRLMRTIGLPGRAFLPLIVGYGCNVPAIMAARTLASTHGVPVICGVDAAFVLSDHREHVAPVAHLRVGGQVHRARDGGGGGVDRLEAVVVGVDHEDGVAALQQLERLGVVEGQGLQVDVDALVQLDALHRVVDHREVTQP